jgi:DNA-binding response OmpR family regulator
MAQKLVARKAMMTKRTDFRILVVDDHQDLGETLKAVLEAAGCAVDVAITPFAAITLSDLQHYDLVLVDFRMPQMNGLALLEFLRPRDHTCTLMITGYPEDFSPADAAAGGAQGILVKPLEISRLLSVVDTVRAQRSYGGVTIRPDLLSMRETLPA